VVRRVYEVYRSSEETTQTAVAMITPGRLVLSRNLHKREFADMRVGRMTRLHFCVIHPLLGTINVLPHIASSASIRASLVS
jgi:hypothetical protein